MLLPLTLIQYANGIHFCRIFSNFPDKRNRFTLLFNNSYLHKKQQKILQL